jgi:hypothetical protein
MFMKAWAWQVPKMLTFNQKVQHVDVSAKHLHFLGLEQNILPEQTATLENMREHHFT